MRAFPEKNLQPFYSVRRPHAPKSVKLPRKNVDMPETLKPTANAAPERTAIML
jgi:hypothetical protein